MALHKLHRFVSLVTFWFIAIHLFPVLQLIHTRTLIRLPAAFLCFSCLQHVLWMLNSLVRLFSLYLPEVFSCLFLIASIRLLVVLFLLRLLRYSNHSMIYLQFIGRTTPLLLQASAFTIRKLPQIHGHIEEYHNALVSWWKTFFLWLYTFGFPNAISFRLLLHNHDS